MESNNTHKEPIGLVKEIYHDWGWGKDEDFIKDVKDLKEEAFAIQFHSVVGMQIRNSYGFWKGDTYLHRWFIENGVVDPDSMSHYIFIELHRYAKKQFNN